MTENCVVCGKFINEIKDTYEITETYLDGNYEFSSYVHTDCRYKQTLRSKGK